MLKTEQYKQQKTKKIRHLVSPPPIGNKKKKILQFIDQVSNTNKVLIYDVEFTTTLVRIYIENKKLGVNLKICEAFMKSLISILSHNGIEGVEFEVSSPGLERPLKKDWHFKEAVGENIKIHTNQPIFCTTQSTQKDKQKTILTGLLQNYTPESICIKQDDLEWSVPINIIKKAQIIFVPLTNKNKRS